MTAAAAAAAATTLMPCLPTMPPRMRGSGGCTHTGPSQRRRDLSAVVVSHHDADDLQLYLKHHKVIV